ncbi:MAG: hypothetical protein Q9213_006173 [Squamulea squamosa]
MTLVAYSDSDDSGREHESKQGIGSISARSDGLKRKRSPYEEQQSDLPPLPDSFHDLYSSTTRVSNQDDPSLHAGRQRQFPHVEGQWPTHVYIEFLTDVGQTLPPKVQLHSLLQSDLGTVLPLHISLSRTMMLATYQRQPFTDSLQSAIQESGVRPFTVASDGLRWVANHENNRWFLVVHIKKPPGDELNKLLRASNGVARRHGQPSLYVPQDALRAPVAVHGKYHTSWKRRISVADPLKPEADDFGNASTWQEEDMSAYFHLSIGWTLEEPAESRNEISACLSSQIATKLELAIESVKAKIGNSVVDEQEKYAVAAKIPLYNRGVQKTDPVIIGEAAHECVCEDALVHLKSYKYSSVDKSLISRYILKYYWNGFVELLPLWLAPNMVTLLGFFFILADIILLEIFIPDLVGPAPSWLYYSFACGVWMYSTMDNVDGKQARRTGQSSGLGELFDHGIDSLNCTLASLCETAAMGLGSSPKGVFTALIPCLPMFFSTWETYHTHTLYLGYFNGPTEGLIIACSMMIASGYYGPQIWTQPMTDLIDRPEIFGDASVVDVWIPVIFSTFLFIHLPACVLNVVKARRAQKLPLAPVFVEWLPIVIFTASSTSWLYSPYSTLMRENRLVLFCLTMSFVFGRMTTKIILAHLTRQPFPMWTVMLFPLIGGAILGNLPRVGLPAVTASVELWYLRAYFVFALVAYFRWALLVINSICDYLGINCLTITPKPAPNQTAGTKAANGDISSKAHQAMNGGIDRKRE